MPVLNETSDATDSAATAYSMGVGDYFFGALDTNSNSDWIEVSLTAGQTYTFAMAGIGATTDQLTDPYLLLRDAAGVELEADDDGGPGRNSAITYTAASSGTYYLDAQSYLNSYTGDYALSMTTGTRANYDTTMAASNLIRTGLSWASSPGADATVTWSIRDFGTEPSGGNNFIAPSSAQIATIQEVLAYYEDISGLTLNQVTSPLGTSNDATMVFGAYSANDGSGAYAYLPGNTASGANAGDVWLNNNSVSTGSLPIGSYSYFVLLHEIGHAMGLSHPGDYNAELGVSITYENSAQLTQDSHQYSLMSYFDEGNTASTMNSYPDTLMLHDLLALHQLYGADYSYHSGNTTYGFNATVGGAYDFTTNTDPFLSIWDGGGTDMLNLSGFIHSQFITLEAGAFSNVGGYIGNLSIAIGAVIENAIGGSSQDEMIGNAVANALKGGAGNDRLWGEGGDDRLWGETGDDTLYGGAQSDLLDGGSGDDDLFGEGGQDTLYGQDGNDSMRGGWFNDWLYGGAGNDTLRGDGGNDRLFAGSGADMLEGGDGNDTMYGSLGNDSLYGGGQSDRMEGGEGDDELFGEGGQDTLYGQDGNDNLSGGWFNDWLYAGDGNDTVQGDGGNDRLFAGDGNDLLEGGTHNDTLYGGYGLDTLDGGTGNDRMSGGMGSDRFVFVDGFGQDQITDFNALNDMEKLDLSGVSGISDLSDLVNNHMSQVGANVVIDDGSGNSITLQNVQLNDLLDGNDFIF